MAEASLLLVFACLEIPEQTAAAAAAAEAVAAVASLRSNEFSAFAIFSVHLLVTKGPVSRCTSSRAPSADSVVALGFAFQGS